MTTTEVTGHLSAAAILFSMSETALMSCSIFEVMLSRLRSVSLVMCLMSVLAALMLCAAHRCVSCRRERVSCRT